jgi:glycine hydroxymethyltransferase
VGFGEITCGQLEQYEPQIYELIRQEEARQSGSIRLIPSENYVSRAVMTATSSCLTNKYAEGYPGKRYYEGQQVTDLIETIARDRAKKVFKADHANVQPYSGSVANLAAYAALIQPHDTIMGMSLVHGGHLTHGWKVSMTSKFYNSVSYEINTQTGRLDYDMIRDLAKKHRPKVIISGATAYPRTIDFAALRKSPARWRPICQRHRPHRRLGRRGDSPEPRALRGHRLDDHPQDPPRPPRRHAPVQGRARR